MPESHQNATTSPGLTPIRSLPLLDGWIAHIRFSPNGRYLAIAAQNGILLLWNMETSKIQNKTELDCYHVYSVAWSPDSRFVACGTDDRFLHVFEADTGEVVSRIEVYGAAEAEARKAEWQKRTPDAGLVQTTRKRPPRVMRAWTQVRGTEWSPDGRLIASGTQEGVQLWDAQTGEFVDIFRDLSDVLRLCWEPGGNRLAATSYSNELAVWNCDSRNLLYRVPSPYSTAIAWSPDGQSIASCLGESIGILESRSGAMRQVLEGHRTKVRALSYSPDGRLLASRAYAYDPEAPSHPGDHRVILWRTDSWTPSAVIYEIPGGYLHAGLSFSPIDNIIATTGNRDKRVRLWRYDINKLPIEVPDLYPVRYKNAKIALVGDSGVGKSALNLVLSGGKFAPTESTHARKITLLDAEEVRNADGRHEIHERLLWDLAGQPGYRLIHQLHLDDISVCLLVFDSRSEVDPFAGVRHWNRALLQAARLGLNPEKAPVRILVSARCDRGPLGLSAPRLHRVLNELGIADFIETSAKDGTGIRQLEQKIVERVDWESIPSVSSNQQFQRIKGFIVAEQAKDRVLASIDTLRRRFIQSQFYRLREHSELTGDFTACVGRLQSLGLVRRFSFGDLVLLRPELLDVYASSLLFAAKQEPDGMGSILEEDARACRFKIDSDLRVKDPALEKLLALATIEDLLRHEVAFREPAEAGALLVFPSQLTRENPELPDPPGKDTVFSFQGSVLNVYATLVVRLAHSGIFETAEMWKNACTFSAKLGGTCGIFLTETEEATGTITLFYDKRANAATRIQFGDYVYTQLLRRGLPNTVTKVTVLTCPRADCRTAISGEIVTKRVARGFDWVACNVCDTRIPLSPASERSSPSTDEIDRVTARQQLLDTTLFSASAEMQTSGFQKWVGASMTTLALVFTDVVGSTSLANEVGDEEMERIRISHFSRTRSVLKKLSGYEIKTNGDSFMVAFRTAVDALNFCLEVTSDAGHELVRLRAGIHVGPVHVKEEDAFGSMVNYTSRVESKAGSGQIWVSDRAYNDILAERSRAHQSLRWTRRSCLLKGFKGRQRLWFTKPDRSA